MGSEMCIRDSSTSILNVRHLELLSNFMLEVATSLDKSRDTDVDLMRPIMPVVLSAPYLLLEALALSVLHLSQARPEQSDGYRMDATSL